MHEQCSQWMEALAMPPHTHLVPKALEDWGLHCQAQPEYLELWLSGGPCSDLANMSTVPLTACGRQSGSHSGVVPTLAG